MSTRKTYGEIAREKGITRQAAHQAARVAKGLCADCGAKAKKDRVRCKACLKKRADRKRQLAKE